MRGMAKILIKFVLVILTGSFYGSGCGTDTGTGTGIDIPTGDRTVSSITVIDKDGGRVDWSESAEFLAFDRVYTDGYFHLFLMKPDGSEQECLTYGKLGLPEGQKGNPTWHPSGEYIVIQVQEPGYNGTNLLADPGFGLGSNLWVISRDGTAYYQITHLGPELGVLHPHFSHDGKKLMWSEVMPGEHEGLPQDGLGEKYTTEHGEFWATRDWVIKVADFFFQGSTPVLENETIYKPGSSVIGLRESHDFSLDDRKIIFCSIHAHGFWWAPDIYTVELSSGEVRRLTASEQTWDENAHYVPGEDKITYMSTEGYIVGDMKMEVWIMNADGSEKRQLSHFNEAGEVGYTGYPTLCGDNVWSADGTTLCLRRVLVGKPTPTEIVNVGFKRE